VSEIDIEIYNDSTRRIMSTTYAGGSETHNITKSLPSDPTTGLHEYRFVYAPGSVTSLRGWATDAVLGHRRAADLEAPYAQQLIPALAGRPKAEEDRLRLREPDRVRSPVAVSF
jgi:beta-glucanase (GH16 family)